MTKKWENQLRVAMQHPAAATWCAARNAEEAEHQIQMQWERAVPQSKRMSMLIRECGRRPPVTWTTTLRLTKHQRRVLPTLINADWNVWCGIENVAQGTSAVLCKLDTQWAVVYEDGRITRGVVPRLLSVWPMVNTPLVTHVDMPRFVRSVSGTDSVFKMNRY